LAGAETEAAAAFGEESGYTQEQAIYITLLRQQITNSRSANEELRKEINELKFQLTVVKR